MLAPIQVLLDEKECPPMGKGARLRRERAEKREQEAARPMPGHFGLQPQGGPFGAAPRWKQPSSPDEAIRQMTQFMQSMPHVACQGDGTT